MVLLDKNRPDAVVTPSGKLEIRASAAYGTCRRRLWYTATGVPESNPPSEVALTRMDAGNVLEPVVFRAMARSGMETSAFYNRRGARIPQVKMTLSTFGVLRVKITGTPDGKARHPQARAGWDGWLLTEAKSRGDSRYRWIEKSGAILADRSAVAQVALYQHGLRGKEGIEGKTPALLAYINVDSREWHHQVIPPEHLRWSLEKTAEWLAPLSEMLMTDAKHPLGDTPPARDYDATEWQCRQCPFLDTCRPAEPEAPLADGITYAVAAQAGNVVRNFKRHGASQLVTKKMYREGTRVLADYLKQERLEALTMADAGISLRLVSGTDDITWDGDALRQMLTVEQIEAATKITRTADYVRVALTEE